MAARGRFTSRARYYLGALGGAWHPALAVVNALLRMLPDFVSGGVRTRAYRAAGLSLGAGTFIMGNLRLNGGGRTMCRNLTTGRDVVIGDGVVINLDAPVTIEDNVSIGPHVMIYTGTHQAGPGSRRRMPAVLARSVVVEAGSWVGLRATILPGVRIGHGSIVAAGAVVGTSVPPNSLVEGNPARVVRELPWGDR